MFRRQPRNLRSCLPVNLEFAEVRLHVRLEVARACFPVNLEGAQVFSLPALLLPTLVAPSTLKPRGLEPQAAETCS